MEIDAVLDLMWIVICGILVFFMQAGFTLVEAGFTRAKNTSNIIMKNLFKRKVAVVHSEKNSC